MLLCLAMLQIIALVDHSTEEEYLADVMDSIASSSLLASEQAIKVVEALKEKPDIDNSSYFLLPVFSFLRATPRQVMEQGGECGDRSRLVIRLLGTHGIKSSKWALYSKDMKPKHAVVEIKTENGRMVVDPLFGLWFPRPTGGYYGIRELRQSPQILSDRIESLIREGKHPGTSDLQVYPLEEYSYQHAMTVNWDKWIGMRTLYRSLSFIIGPTLDEFEKPALVEAPQLMVALLAGFLQVSLLIFCAIFVQPRRTLSRKTEL